MEVNHAKMIPVIVTGALFMVTFFLIEYTLKNVVASLAMIESPSFIQIVEPKLAPYSDEPLSEERAIKTNDNDVVDVEVSLIPTKPVTFKLRRIVKHLKREGGLTALWRGFPLYVIYSLLQGVVAKVILFLLPRSFAAYTIKYHIVAVFASLVLCRVHMVWVHCMVAAPQKGRNTLANVVHRLGYARRLSTGKALLLPTLVYSLASHAAFVVPQLLAEHVLPAIPEANNFFRPSGEISMARAVQDLLALSLIAFSALIITRFLVLPASTTLTRIEAAFLPEDENTIVPFDRAALLDEIDLTLRGGATALFLRAWRSVDRKTILRLVRLYVKIAAVCLAVSVVGTCVLIGEVLALAGDERIKLLVKSGSAQLQLAAMEAANAQQQGVPLSTVN